MRILFILILTMSFVLGKSQNKGRTNNYDEFTIRYCGTLLGGMTTLYEIGHRRDPSLRSMAIYDKTIGKKYVVPCEPFYRVSTLRNCQDFIYWALVKEYGFNQLSEMGSDYFYSGKILTKEYIKELFYWYYTICEVTLSVNKTKLSVREIDTHAKLENATKNNENQFCEESYGFARSSIANSNQILFFDGRKFFVISYFTPIIKNHFYSLFNLKQANIKSNITLTVL